MALELIVGFDHLPLNDSETDYTLNPYMKSLADKFDIASPRMVSLKEISIDGISFRGLSISTTSVLSLKTNQGNNQVFGFRCTANNFTDFAFQHWQNTGSSWVSKLTTLAELGIDAGKGSYYIEIMTSWITSGFASNRNSVAIWVNGLLKAQLYSTVHPYFNIPANMVLSDFYFSNGAISQGVGCPLGSIRVKSSLVSSVVNEDNLLPVGSNRTSVEELGYFCDQNTYKKDSYLLLDRKNVESTLQFPALSKDSIASVIQLSCSRGPTSSAQVTLTPITKNGDMPPVTFTPSPNTPATIDVKTLVFSENASAADTNLFKVKVKY